MKTNFLAFTVLMFVTVVFKSKATEVIRINQLGYLPKSVKVAVFISSENR